MKRIFLLFCILSSIAVTAQENYWQQKVSYNINANLDEKSKTINANQTVVYTNNSPSTLQFIWFHLWPNAYKNDKTALYQQLINDDSRRGKLEKNNWGGISNLDISIGGKKITPEAHSNPTYIDVVKINLPQPLAPGASVTLNIKWDYNLPVYFSRSGHQDGEYMICQWYPKPAVYDKDGWHEMPYLDMGEYYSEFADFDVKITLPANFIVGATGVLQNADELQQYKTTGAYNTKNRGDKPQLYKPASGTKTLRYIASNVPDFAWFADKDFVIQYDTVILPSGKTADAFTFYHNKPKSLWVNSIDYVKDATRFYSRNVGEYDYPTVQAVEGPKNNSSGGMEYPMITLITSPDAEAAHLDAVIAHEVGHNWFMSMLGSNERMHTWQDEGLNTYWQFRYEAEKYRGNSLFGSDIPNEVRKLPLSQFMDAIYGALASIPIEAKIEQPALSFKNSEDYGMASYFKTSIWLYIMEKSIGKDKLDKAFKDYFATWKHKHITPEDLKVSFEKSTGEDLTSLFKLLEKNGSLLE